MATGPATIVSADLIIRQLRMGEMRTRARRQGAAAALLSHGQAHEPRVELWPLADAVENPESIQRNGAHRAACDRSIPVGTAFGSHS